MAPELQECNDAHEINRVVSKNPGAADLWSLGKIALLLSTGSTDMDIQLAGNQVGSDLADFIQQCLLPKPHDRLSPKTLLHHVLFDPRYIEKRRAVHEMDPYV